MTNPPRQIDLNADLGEDMGDDDALLALVSSANIACGGHAGGPSVMVATLTQAKARGVVVGAHPGYADRANFGRVDIPMTMAALEQMLARQVGALCGVAALLGVRVAYVKPHGALYNLAARDAHVSAALCRAMRAVDPALALLCLSGSVTERLAQTAGIAVAAEVFADRAYLANGALMPRTQPGAVIHDPDAVVARVKAMLSTGAVTAADGTRLPLRIDSICLHGDTPGAVMLARRLRHAVQDAGWRIAAFAG
jgi:5-oxoprolinase (ATP-hydrolysing) subunit A